jgi:hypothetical protein
MTDFATLIEGAIERELRQRLVQFISTYEHVELGRARLLTLDEASMVLTCLDHFAMHTSVTNLGVTEIAGLRRRLDLLAREDTNDIAAQKIANTCFDALACIAALEARLRRTLDRGEARKVRQNSPANDC